MVTTFWAKMVRRLLLLSNSTNYGCEYLEHCDSAVRTFLAKNEVSRLLFIPYALNDYDKYTDKVRKAFKQMNIEVDGIHEDENPKERVKVAQAIFIGGGNTFRLLHTLYKHDLIDAIRRRVLEDGIPYMGASAGTNVATVSICTTNDMPIIYPPSFQALNLVSFNINPHYVNPDANSQHMGETREERIKQYHEIAGMPPVLGLREGSWLAVDGDEITLRGSSPAKLFVSGRTPTDLLVDSKIEHSVELK